MAVGISCLINSWYNLTGQGIIVYNVDLVWCIVFIYPTSGVNLMLAYVLPLILAPCGCLCSFIVYAQQTSVIQAENRLWAFGLQVESKHMMWFLLWVF